MTHALLPWTSVYYMWDPHVLTEVSCSNMSCRCTVICPVLGFCPWYAAAYSRVKGLLVICVNMRPSSVKLLCCWKKQRYASVDFIDGVVSTLTMFYVSAELHCAELHHYE